MIPHIQEAMLTSCLQTNQVRHSGRTLYEHLKGTHDLLESWGLEPDVQTAGLFHSIYGTNAFHHESIKPTDKNRELMRYLIGERSEFLAYVFCVTDRPRAFIEAAHALKITGTKVIVGNRVHQSFFVLVPKDIQDLLDIEAANLIEQHARSKVLARIAAAPGLSPVAYQALREVLRVRIRREEQGPPPLDVHPS